MRLQSQESLSHQDRRRIAKLQPHMRSALGKTAHVNEEVMCHDFKAEAEASPLAVAS